MPLENTKRLVLLNRIFIGYLCFRFGGCTESVIVQIGLL